MPFCSCSLNPYEAGPLAETSVPATFPVFIASKCVFIGVSFPSQTSTPQPWFAAPKSSIDCDYCVYMTDSLITV